MPRDSLGAWPPKLLLYPFRFRDQLTGRWVRARYVATLDDIAARYAEWKIDGPPDVREMHGGSFTPWR